MEFREDGYVPIRQRPEWASTPTALLRPPPSSSQVVAIQSDQDHADLLAYFWTTMNAGECSERVLALSEEIILNFNSAHYSIWAWRWQCLQALETLKSPEGMAAELTLMRRVATDNPKNYQLWNHRRKVALWRGPEHVGDELEFTAACLAYDAKNYHAWAHRQALLLAFATEAKVPALWQEELAFTERLLRDDVRNNSAWTQRYFVIEKVGKLGKIEILGPPREVYDREIDFVVVKINLAPHNEAAYSYLRALTSVHPGAPEFAMGFEQRIKHVCMGVLEQDASNWCAMDLLADYYTRRAQYVEERCDNAAGVDNEGTVDLEGEIMQRRKEAFEASKEAARELFSKLQIAHPSRKAYYMHRLANL